MYEPDGLVAHVSKAHICRNIKVMYLEKKKARVSFAHCTNSLGSDITFSFNVSQIQKPFLQMNTTTYVLILEINLY